MARTSVSLAMRLPFVLALIAVMLAACNAVTNEASLTTSELTAGRWSLDAASGAPSLPDGPISITFSADGSVAGAVACNTYQGSFTASGASEGILEIRELSITEMACDGALRQDAYLQVLRSVEAYRVVEGRTLVLSTGDAGLVFVPQDRE